MTDTTLLEEDFVVAKGDTLPVYEATLRGADGEPVNFSAALVRFRMRLPGSAEWLIDEPAEYVDQLHGKVRYVWRPGDTDQPGRYQARFVATFSDDSVLSFPNEGWRWIEIGDDSGAFAVVQDLADTLGIRIDGTDEDRAIRLLRRATSKIQTEARHRIFLKTDDIKILKAPRGRKLWLPEPPVLDVSSIAINGLDIVAGAFSFTRRGCITRGPRIANLGGDDDESCALFWGSERDEITAVYTHGYETVPQELQELCVDVASRAWDNPTDLEQETSGNYSAVYRALELTKDEKKICRRYWVREAA